MALIRCGFTRCVLCEVPIEEEDARVATSHFVDTPFDAFAPYSDAVFHQACFDRWPLRMAFVARYNRMASRRGRRRMGPDGATTAAPALDLAMQDDDAGPGDVALMLPISEPRPGLHLMVNDLPYPLDEARLIISLQAAAPSDLSPQGVLDHLRVGPVEHLKTVLRTGEHALPLSLLPDAPADMRRAGGIAGMTSTASRRKPAGRTARFCSGGPPMPSA